MLRVALAGGPRRPQPFGEHDGGCRRQDPRLV
jgi:hypothetical protein